MGSSVGIESHVDLELQTDSLFIGNDMHKLEKLFKKNYLARLSFATFVAEGTWATKLSLTEGDTKSTRSQDTVWNKFGYKNPFPSSVCNLQPNPTKTWDTQRTANSLSHRKDNTRSSEQQEKSSISKWCLFEDSDRRAVLCMILLPMYLHSEQFRALRSANASISIRPVENVTSDVVLSNTEKINRKEGTHRLRDFLLATISSLRQGELDQYLADPERSWTSEFKAALFNIPVSLMISAVPSDPLESSVIFVNSDPQGCESGRSDQWDPRNWPSTIGKNLCDLCSEQLSPGGARQVEKAILNAKGYKVCVPSGQMCTLRALKPIYDRKGKYAYAAVVETPHFENPELVQDPAANELNEKRFQIVEDLLTVLPLLLKQ